MLHDFTWACMSCTQDMVTAKKNYGSQAIASNFDVSFTPQLDFYTFHDHPWLRTR